MSRGRILVVEDEALVAEDIRWTLERQGFRVVGIADSAPSALDLAERTGPELALMDITIKGSRDGIETARQLRRQFGTSVVFLTSYTVGEVVERARRTDPYAYLTKPFDDRELSATVEGALRQHRASHAARDESQPG